MRQDHLDLHLKHEGTNWWFVARERILRDIIEREVLAGDGAGAARHDAEADAEREPILVDIGCAGGGFVETLAAYGRAFGIDASPEAVRFARDRGVDVRLGRLPDSIPLRDGSVSLVTLLDVVEHIEDDDGAMREVHRLLEPGGHLVVTVPAYRFLWSYHDDVNGHKRRYTSKQLRRLIERSGLVVRSISYFNAILFPPIAAIRLARRLGGRRQRADSPVVPAPVNSMLTQIFGIERRLLRWGSLPFGVSLVAVARKPPSARRAALAASTGARHV